MFKLDLPRQRNQRSKCQHLLDHRKSKFQKSFGKKIYFCFIDYAKAFDSVDENKLRKILKEMVGADHHTCLLRHLYAGEQATVRIGHGTTNWFEIGKGVCQACILPPCLFNLYAEYIMQNAWGGWNTNWIQIPRRNINNLRYTDDTTLMAENKEELKSLLMKVKEESGKNWLKTQYSKDKDHGIWSHHFMANRWGYSGNSERLYFLGLQNHCRW